jgi:DNA-binding response OmpR family regulator
MTICPNCGYKDSSDEYAPELIGIDLPSRQHDVLLRLRQARGGRVTSEHLVDCLYGHMGDGGPEEAQNCISLFVMRIRPKIAEYGWAIENERRRGYRLVRVAA